ncbi:hypothetical protein GFS31_42890 (plasmid) [Leptolyngbya sp. BL0902]|nr:hypothetical protein [Leptolyngbya sp. BL0902]QQE67576.1 hypothetical protein GFS31_42890 [Leptolyngbya sp. BL0902]
MTEPRLCATSESLWRVENERWANAQFEMDGAAFDWTVFKA